MVFQLNKKHIKPGPCNPDPNWDDNSLLSRELAGRGLIQVVYLDIVPFTYSSLTYQVIQVNCKLTRMIGVNKGRLEDGRI